MHGIKRLKKSGCVRKIIGTVAFSFVMMVGQVHAETPAGLAGFELSTTAPAPHAARVERVEWNHFQNSYRIFNDDAEVVVVPQAGRVMSYRLIGRRNVLWTSEGIVPAPVYGTWTNYGGEKAWIWPQEAWKKLDGKEWPPPAGMEGPGEADLIEGGVRWKTAPVNGFGVRVCREIKLAPTGSRVTTDTWLEPAPTASRVVDVPFAPWSIMQVPATDALLVRRTGAQTYAWGWKPMNGHLFKSITPVGADVLVVRRPRDASPKIGFDADLLAAVYDDLMVVVRDTSPESSAATSSERAQLYADEDRPTSAISSYIEMEFIAAPSPLNAQAVGSHLTTTWDILPVVPPVDGKKTNDWLAGLLNTVPK